jgi:hypothetical protein
MGIRRNESVLRTNERNSCFYQHQVVGPHKSLKLKWQENMATRLVVLWCNRAIAVALHLTNAIDTRYLVKLGKWTAIRRIEQTYFDCGSHLAELYHSRTCDTTDVSPLNMASRSMDRPTHLRPFVHRSELGFWVNSISEQPQIPPVLEGREEGRIQQTRIWTGPH